MLSFCQKGCFRWRQINLSLKEFKLEVFSGFVIGFSQEFDRIPKQFSYGMIVFPPKLVPKSSIAEYREETKERKNEVGKCY